MAVAVMVTPVIDTVDGEITESGLAQVMLTCCGGKVLVSTREAPGLARALAERHSCTVAA